MAAVQDDMNSKKPLRGAINRHLIGKNDSGDPALYAWGWENVELTLDELVGAVSADGIAYTAQLTGGRKTANFYASDVASVDVDHGMTIEQALAHPFVKRHAAFVYCTSRHTPLAHRLRVVFRLGRTVTDAAEMRAIQRSLALRLLGDPAATDATRIFFGNPGAQTFLINGELDVELMAELIAQSKNTVPNPTGGGLLVGVRSTLAIDPAMPIKLANGGVLSFSSIAPKTSCHCPFHADRHASAFIVTNQNGVQGLHCSGCRATYWPAKGADEVDFRAFDRAAHAILEYVKSNREIGPLGQFFGLPPGKAGLVGAHIEITDRQAAPTELSRGLTLIKSPKGSGKTLSLKRLIAGRHKVLLIGHRRSLIRQSCARLELPCYLDRLRCFERAGICLDSLHQVRGSERYDCVILDESEQLLAHFLSDTIDGARGASRDALFKSFVSILARAKHVIALDADLGWVTFNTLTNMMAQVLPDPAQGDLFDKKRPAVHLWLNEAKPGAGKNIQVFRSKPQLIADLLNAVVAGKRVFVTANSKALVNDIAMMVSEKLPKVRKLLLTADTLLGSVQKAFLENPQEHALKYDVILTSPAVGTGVDISFPDKHKLVDVVYGFGEANINTAWDLDQQIGRVRDPGAVRVWVNPRRFHYEVNLDAVRRELLEQRLFKNLVIDHNGPGGTARYAEDPLIEMAALVLSQQRASKNALREHFIAHKRWQGYHVELVEPAGEDKAAGRVLLEAGKRVGREKYVERILAAPPLRFTDFTRVSNASKAGGAVNEDELLSFQRTKLELFYRRPVTAELISDDGNGMLRRRIMLFDAVERTATGQVPDPGRMRQLKAAYIAATGGIPADIRVELAEAAERRAGARNPDRGHDPLDRRATLIRSNKEATSAITRLLQFSPVLQGPLWDADTAFDGSSLANFARFAAANKAALENQLGIEIRRDIAAKPVSQLKSVLRLVGLDLVKAGTAKVAGRKIYSYRLDGDALQRIKEVLADREGTTGWRFMAEIHGWPAEREEADDFDDEN